MMPSCRQELPLPLTSWLAVQVTSSALEAVRQIKAEVQDLLVRIGAIRQVLLARLLPRRTNNMRLTRASGIGIQHCYDNNSIVLPNEHSWVSDSTAERLGSGATVKDLRGLKPGR